MEFLDECNSPRKKDLTHALEGVRWAIAACRQIDEISRANKSQLGLMLKLISEPWRGDLRQVEIATRTAAKAALEWHIRSFLHGQLGLSYKLPAMRLNNNLMRWLLAVERKIEKDLGLLYNG